VPDEPLCRRGRHEPDIEHTHGRDGDAGGWLNPDAYPLTPLCTYCGAPIMVARLTASYWALLPPDAQP
jgi:hypothetical protein